MRAKTGRLYRGDKKTALKDVKVVRQEANELARQTRKDLFKPGKMTLREMEKKERHIDTELNRLENLKGLVNHGHEEYHRLQNAKHRLQSTKELLKLHKQKAKKEQKLQSLKPKKSRHRFRRPKIEIIRNA